MRDHQFGPRRNVAFALLLAAAHGSCGGDPGGEESQTQLFAATSAPLVFTASGFKARFRPPYYTIVDPSPEPFSCPLGARAVKLTAEAGITLRVCVFAGDAVARLPFSAAGCTGDHRGGVSAQSSGPDIALENAGSGQCMSRKANFSVATGRCDAANLDQRFRYETITARTTRRVWTTVAPQVGPVCLEWPGSSTSYARLRHARASDRCLGFYKASRSPSMLLCQRSVSFGPIAQTSAAVAKARADALDHGLYFSTEGTPPGWKLLRRTSAYTSTIGQAGRDGPLTIQVQNSAPYGQWTLWRSIPR